MEVREENLVDSLLEEHLVWSFVPVDLFHGLPLPADHPFSWKSVEQHPKDDHGHVLAPRCDEKKKVVFFKDLTYRLLHTGGFVRCCTDRGRVFWNAQNETGHVTPDWKFHASVQIEDIPKAWNILVALFMEMRCEIGMKATYLKQDEWSSSQRGREITIYVFSSDSSYKGYMEEIASDDLPFSNFYLGKELEIYSTVFWFNFVMEAERRLLLHGVEARGCADGDLALPNCKYLSLRNEAFVKVNGELCYPPNNVGWNAARHACPFWELLFFLKQAQNRK